MMELETFITSDCCDNYPAYNNKNLESWVFFVPPQSDEILTPRGENVTHTFKSEEGTPLK